METPAKSQFYRAKREKRLVAYVNRTFTRFLGLVGYLGLCLYVVNSLNKFDLQKKLYRFKKNSNILIYLLSVFCVTCAKIISIIFYDNREIIAGKNSKKTKKHFM